MASNTGRVALSELLITPKISAVAVCCPVIREFARALLLGFEQADVLDRDHRLVGEGGQ
jgi:hypothetical protein